MRRSWTSAWILLSIALACAFATPAAAQALTAELLLTEGSPDRPPISAPVILQAQAPTPRDTLRLIVPDRASGYWLRLSCDRGIDPEQNRVLLLRGPRASGAVTYYPPGGGVRVIQDAESGRVARLQRGWTLPLPQGWPRGQVAYAHVPSTAAGELSLGFATAPELSRREVGDSRFMWTAFVVMLLMALAMLALWAVQRDIVYLHYGAYQIAIAFYLLLLFGDLLQLLRERWPIGTAFVALGWTLATLATIFQLGFSLRFLELRSRLPRLAKVVSAMQWANIAWLAVLLVLGERVYRFWYIGGNILFLAAIPLLLYAAYAAWRRGAPYAGYYLLGWTPLMLFAAVLAAYTFGAGRAEWADRGLVVAVVLESGVLVLALTQRAARHHRSAQPDRPARR